MKHVPKNETSTNAQLNGTANASPKLSHRDIAEAIGFEIIDAPVHKLLPETLDDAGIADFVWRTASKQIRYTPERQSWWNYNGRYWEIDSLAPIGLIAAAAREIQRIAADIADPKKSVQMFKVGSKYRGAAGARGVEFFLRVVPGARTSVSEFNTPAHMFNVRNGTIDLRTGELRDHDPNDLLTDYTNVEFNRSANVSFIKEFVLSVCGGDRDKAEFLQRLFGSAMIAGNHDRIFVIFSGVGRNGKSTLSEAINAVVGSYGVVTSAETFGKKYGGGIPNDIAALHTSRFVFTSETTESRELDMALVKRLTGQDTITARFLHSEFFEFIPKFTPFLSTNSQPMIPDDSEAGWDRILSIPFDVRFGSQGSPEIDKNMGEKLANDSQGLLAWLVEGCLAYQKDGLQAPPSVLTATSEYRLEQDFVQSFIDDRCVIESDVHVPTGVLYEHYVLWCKDTGQKAINMTAFGRRLSAKGFGDGRATVNGKQKRVRKGLGIDQQ